MDSNKDKMKPNPPTPAAQGGARKGKGFSDTALSADPKAFSGCNFCASPSFRGMVFPCREVIFSMVFSHAAKAAAAAGGKGSQNS